jgi:hypothetical protein
MTTVILFYLCPTCFDVSEKSIICHDHRMIRCDVDTLDDRRRSPIIDTSGRVYTRAPRWFLEAVGWKKAGSSAD